MIWHDEAERFAETGQLDPTDRCLCPDCSPPTKPQEA